MNAHPHHHAVPAPQIPKHRNGATRGVAGFGNPAGGLGGDSEIATQRSPPPTSPGLPLGKETIAHSEANYQLSIIN